MRSNIMKRLRTLKRISPQSTNCLKAHFEGGELMQSYDSIIVVKLYGEDGGVFLGAHWDYSAATGRHRNPYLREGIAETRIKIENGTYTVIDDLT